MTRKSTLDHPGKWYTLVYGSLLVYAVVFHSALWVLRDFVGRSRLFDSLWPGGVVQFLLFIVVWAPLSLWILKIADAKYRSSDQGVDRPTESE